mmetsp:Transcript_60610/g.141195  ORF Transcript_60610/g.141195 Transcript_60610/m.141195 type:complete len:221 (-) Transcript_60610:3-665(-)
MLHLPSSDEVLNVSPLHVELVPLPQTHDSAVRSDDLSQPVIAHPNLHIHVLWCLCVCSEVQGLLALGHVAFHVLVEDCVVHMEVLLLRVVQLLILLLWDHQPDFPTELFYPGQAVVQVGQQAAPVAVHEVVVEAKACSHFPGDAVGVRVLRDKALHFPGVVQDLLHDFFDHLIVELWEPSRALEILQKLDRFLHVQHHCVVSWINHTQQAPDQSPIDFPP